MKVVHAFDARQTVCWATTFTFDPGFFETFLLRRLGEPPINATVLADHAKLATTWARMDPADNWRFRRANRDYLVRGVAWPGGAFHAKTILLGNEKGGTLLVGSGNIGLSGLDHGREVFARFQWSTPDDKGAFGSWRSWMEAIVAHTDDAQVRFRWANLLGRLTWLPTEARESSFVTNFDRPLLEQLADGLATPVDRLIATAPFFDHRLDALKDAVDRLRPRALELLVGDRASVDGPLLGAYLQTLEIPWRVAAFVPREYVHAKVIGAFTEGRARVLAGSANLSAPALLRIASNGNVEAGVIVEADAQRAEGWFAATNETVPLDLDAIAGLALVKSEPDDVHSIRLIAAHLSKDKRIHIEVAHGSVVEGLHLTDGVADWALAALATKDPADITQRPLLWLADATTEPRSNRVPLDDRAALNAILAVREATADRPPEFDDDTARHPLGQLLTELYRSALFEIDDTPAGRQAAVLAGSDATLDEAFWDQFVRDQIRLDPRISRYHSWVAGFHGLPPADEFRWLIEQMLDRAPQAGEFHFIDGSVVKAGTELATTVRWEPSRRTLASALNALKRWALALNDRRVRWYVADYAPIDHYERLTATILQIWVQGPSWPDASPTLGTRMAALFRVLIDAFVRRDRGYLALLDDEERERALELLKTGRTPEIAAALAHAALAKVAAKDFFGWQPALVPAIDLGVLRATEASADLVGKLTGIRPTPAAIEARLRLVATYTDDDHWAADVADETGITSVKVVPSGHPAFALGLVIEPGVDLVLDPGVVRLVRRALDYRRSGSVRVKAGADLLTASIGGRIVVSRGGEIYESVSLLKLDELRDLEWEGGSLTSMLEAEGSTAL